MLTEYLDEILLNGEKHYKAAICLCCFSSQENYSETLQFLHPKERRYYNTLLHKKRSETYLLGRYAAKRASAILNGESRLEDILIDNGIFNQPVVIGNFTQNVQVSISHCDEIGAVIAFPDGCPIGIDIEAIRPNIEKLLEKELTEYEKKLTKQFSYLGDRLFTLFWTVKESLSKILKTGLTLPFNFYEINNLHFKNGYIISCFNNFSQYQTISFNLGNYMCSVTYPKNLELVFNISLLQTKFNEGFISKTGFTKS